MRILLAAPHPGERNSLLDRLITSAANPAFTLEQLAACTPSQYEVEYVDERFNPIDGQWDGDVVGISTATIDAFHAYEIADSFRRQGKTVILGGYHPSALPDEAKLHADAVVIGEAEISWPQALKDFEAGSLKPFYHADPVDPALIPSPRRLPDYVASRGIVQATRGCPQQCMFCAIQTIEGSRFRARPIEKVVEEVRSCQNNRIFFADSSMTINSQYTKQLFRALRHLNKSFSCFGNIDVLRRDEELLSIASEAGCVQWLIGFESVDRGTIQHIGKKTNRVEDYASAAKKIRDYGMDVMGLFVFGFDTDTPSVFDYTLEAVNTMELERVGFSMLTPYPGTAIYRQFEREGRLLTKDWSRYNLRNVVFQPKNMTVRQLEDGRNALADEFYSLANCLRRSLSSPNLDFTRLKNSVVNDFFINKFYRN